MLEPYDVKVSCPVLRGLTPLDIKKIMEELNKIKPKYTKTELTQFIDENQFMDAYVELLKQSITLLYLIVGDKYCDLTGEPKKISRDAAIIGGNLTRLIKLNTSFLQNIVENKLEICYILSRCIAETAINIQYMLIEGEESVLKNYIKYSLITEKSLWNTIKENIREKNGDELAIEKRMKSSILSSFEKSDFDIDEVNRSSKWKSIAKRANAVAGEMFYNVFYGISSHSIHGNWQDILFNNLKKDEDGFKLNLEWNRTRPQIIDAPIIFNLTISKLFVEEKRVKNIEKILNTIDLLRLYHSDLLSTHEKFMSK